MMQDRWPPEPPRFDPRRQRRRPHPALLVLAALLVVVLVFSLIWGVQLGMAGR